MHPLLVSLALLVLPLGLGLGVGAVVRLLRGRRVDGTLAGLIALLLPLLVLLWVYPLRPLVGFWDVVLIGVLVGLGALVAVHTWFRDGRELALACASVVIALLLVEMYARVSLPPAPMFPMRSGPNLFLADALQANTTVQGWDIGSNEIVCSAVYGDRYQRKLNQWNDDRIKLPGSYAPRSDVSRRVLHLGDSMVYGLGVEAQERFTAVLERLEPAEHINAALPGTAPDSYLAVIEPWVSAHPVDVVVMYLYESNDYAGLDSPSPCCKFEPILSYDNGHAVLRCAEPFELDLDGVKLDWLRIISPPPYILRALLPYSRAAAEAATALVARKVSGEISESVQAELDTIIETAAETLRTRGISFVVIILPVRWNGGSAQSPDRLGSRMMESARKAGVPVFDAHDVLRAAVETGARPFLGDHDGHFSPAGHKLMAEWLSPLLSRPPPGPGEG